MDNINLTNGGYVVLPVDEYAWLVRELEQAREAIKVSKYTYSAPERLEVSIDPDWLHREALLKAKKKFDLSEYNVKHPDDLLITSVTLAVRNETTSNE